MNKNNEEIIKRYYKAWINKNLEDLKIIYDKKVIFNDPGFKNLNYEKIIKMWMIWFNKGTNKSIDAQYEIIESKNDIVKSKVVIKYNFGKKENPVTNYISTNFKIRDGKIINQLEKFDFIKWFNQAFAIKKQKPKFIYKILQKLMQIKTKKMVK